VSPPSSLCLIKFGLRADSEDMIGMVELGAPADIEFKSCNMDINKSFL
jgi:hypothetical protein